VIYLVKRITIHGLQAAVFLTGFSVLAGEPETASEHASALDKLPPWQEGYLDIHHISIDGDATFIVMPDGTTMLFDAGVRNKDHFEARVPPLKAAQRRPDASKRSGELYADYIRPLLPDQHDRIDYGVVSHFDSDHFGYVTPESPDAATGDYKLTGIIEVDALIGIDRFFDRAYPGYDEPADMRTAKAGNATVQNYLDFVEHRAAEGGLFAAVKPGALNQFTLLHDTERFPAFSIRNIKAGSVGWSGENEDTFQIFAPGMAIRQNGGYSENPFSIGLQFHYGDFDYFTGGDMLGPPMYTHEAWQDSETPLAPVIGEVDAFALNHHGVRDANNETFLSALQPRIAVMSGGTSDHPGQEVFYRVMSEKIYEGEREFFATYVFEETKVAYGPWFADPLTDRTGHIVIRVAPGGGSYMVYVLDDAQPGHAVRRSYGPYQSR